MKKISLIALAFTTGTALFAQTSKPTPMAVATRFGIKAGVNLAEFRANGYSSGSQPDNNMKTSMNGGFFVNVPLGTNGLSVQPEVMYSGQGSKMSVKTTVGTVTTTSTYEQDLSYINVPIMLQWKSQGGFLIETGPQAGFLVRAQQDGPGSATTDNKDNFDKFDFSWGAGLGYLSRIGLGINARYNLGLSNTLDDGGGNNSSNDGPELKNKVIQIGLFWNFGAGK
jgi:hypothetical protein